MIDVALAQLLRDHAGAGDRVYSGGERVEVTRDLPQVVYTFLGLLRLYCDDGNVGLVKARYQLDIFASRPTAARTIADNIRVALDGHKSTIDATKIERIYFENEQVHPPEPGQAVGQAATAARYTQDLIVDYRERTT